MKKLTRMEVLRRSKRLTNQLLAERLGVSPGLVALVEGRHMRCYPKSRKAISETLGVDQAELFGAESFARLAGSEGKKEGKMA